MNEPLLHIASFVVHHRIDAADALDAALSALPGAELALREGSRSIVLAEGPDEGALVERVEALRHVDGVLGVSLVHHHAEPREALLQEIAP